MGTVKYIIQSIPDLAINAIKSYFEPIFMAHSFVKGLSLPGSPSTSIIKSEIEKLRGNAVGREWYSIHQSIDQLAHDTFQRAALRKTRINWLYSSYNEAYESLFEELYSNNAAFGAISHKLFVGDLVELKSQLDESDKEHTYNIIILDEEHHSIIDNNYEIYEKLFNETKHLSLGFTATKVLKGSAKSDDYINFMGLSEPSDLVIGAKALQLKIEEFISTIPELTSKPTGRE
ncbi:hypothetical protein AN214_01219 [Pseudoalteromonas sp. P1-9]|uniref:DEAD/DEAH box helicase family protein n=1 Tax=Pseudoalteromonas sp. P1-9 TaxID=1710354 RepID=UPI0006D60997|nr:DEAD/DEAH box helicase family protein [Pseudoalteromonas sp. P1-9]KPV96758.1 hypothetical protein AN214_01219 [Pseudoalteromonas sp. P1-9]